MDFVEVRDIVVKHIDHKGMVKEMFDKIVKEEARKLAAKTENKIDDVAVELFIGILDKVVAEIK